MFDEIIKKLGEHPRYGLGIQEAANAKTPFVLDYHRHPQLETWCVSIKSRKENPLRVLGQPEELPELAHIRGFGRKEEECLPLMTAFGQALKEAYSLEMLPQIFKNGQPFKG